MSDSHDDASSLDTSLDTQTYPVDYVSELFNAIDWGSRVKTRRPTDHWIDPGSWDKHSYTMKYLEYRIEEGQIDLTNPFHIEESNKIRTRLEKKRAVSIISRKTQLKDFYFNFLFSVVRRKSQS